MDRVYVLSISQPSGGPAAENFDQMTFIQTPYSIVVVFSAFSGTCSYMLGSLIILGEVVQGFKDPTVKRGAGVMVPLPRASVAAK